VEQEHGGTTLFAVVQHCLHSMKKPINVLCSLTCRRLGEGLLP
jgi:hypothetical protein